jgi:hypothetical protein
MGKKNNTLNMKKTKKVSKTPTGAYVVAKDLSRKVETKANSARLAKAKPKPYKGSGNSTESIVKRTTYPSGSTISKTQVSVGKDKFTRYNTTSPKKRK